MYRAWRHLPLLGLLLLPGCEAAGPVGGALAGINILSIATIGRSVPDAVVSVVANRDCSVVRLDRGLRYCKSEEPPPAPPAFCTRSLGGVDCWRQPPLAIPYQRGVADGPVTLTTEQEAHRTRGWPGLF